MRTILPDAISSRPRPWLAGGASGRRAGLGRSAHAAGSDVLKVGLIGCGGRGTGAAGNALDADKNVKLVAMADAFADRLQASLESAARSSYADRVDVPDERCFVGFDAYQKVIAQRRRRGAPGRAAALPPACT